MQRLERDNVLPKTRHACRHEVELGDARGNIVVKLASQLHGEVYQGHGVLGVLGKVSLQDACTRLEVHGESSQDVVCRDLGTLGHHIFPLRSRRSFRDA